MHFIAVNMARNSYFIWSQRLRIVADSGMTEGGRGWGGGNHPVSKFLVLNIWQCLGEMGWERGKGRREAMGLI